MVVGPEGELWVARDIAPGLLVFRNGEWKQIGEVRELPTALLVDSQGDLWIGCSAGLLHYDGRAWKTIEGAASFASITSLAEDRGGRIWVAGEDGLSVYDPGGR
jgi:ligand-binding sensor domain-containing protein